MTEQPKRSRFAADSIAAPLRHSVFRRIWLASLVSNLGLLIQGVGAAWAMTQMTSSADKVALVQTALMLPIMLISMPAGAIADMYDRRIVALVSLSIALAGATALTRAGLAQPRHPEYPAGASALSSAAAWRCSDRPGRPRSASRCRRKRCRRRSRSNGISYNIARSFGPAIGGIVVATAGAVAAFAANAVLYLPLMVVLFLWSRTSEPSRLPRERLNRAIVSGVRYIANSPSIRIVLARTLVTGLIGGSVSALMPLVARDLLHGGAQTYGIMLGAFGMGAVIGALNIAEVRKRMSGEAAVRACALSMAGAIAAIALSQQAGADRGGAGARRRRCGCWRSPCSTSACSSRRRAGSRAARWRRSRPRLPAASRSEAGAGAISPTAAGVETALLVSAGLMLLSPLLGIWLRMPPVGARNEAA